MSSRGLAALRPSGLPFRLARRELRGGLKGFRIFLACLALGVAAIATVQSMSSGILAGIKADGRSILGGDVAVRLIYRPATPTELASFAVTGAASTTAEMRAMARTADGARSVLVELKAVDGLYPLYGAVDLRPAGLLEGAFRRRDGRWGAVIEDAGLDRLGLAIGDTVRVGDASFELRGAIVREPDRASSGGFSLGPRLIISLDALPATGLLQPGSLVYWSYRVKLPPADDAAAQWVARVAAEYPDAPWRVRTFANAAPQLEEFIGRLTLFLTLVGLTALLVGGVGVGNAVRSYLDSKIATIATLKCLGARGGLIFETYLVQILVLAAGGIALGLAVGAVAPLLLGRLLSQVLPIAARVGLYPAPLAIAAGFGVLTALTFSLWPLGRAREIPASALFRDTVAPAAGRPRLSYRVAALAAAAGLAGLAIATAAAKVFALWFVGGALAALIVFRLAGWGIISAAAHVRRPRRPGLRLALANLHRPGSPAGSVVLSLGLGLTVLVAIALIEGNFVRRIEETLPASAPAFFFVDIQPGQLAAFEQTVRAVAGTSELVTVPSLRGRIAKVDGRDAESALVNPDHAWVMRSDRGVTYATAPPRESKLVAGQWWPADYAGPPLISIVTDIAKAFGIGVGDQISVNILGRDVTAEVASVREVEWTTLGINFTMIFSPGVLEKAPQTFLATVRATREAEPRVQHDVTARFANVTVVHVRDALDTVNAVLGAIGTAVRVIALITLAAGTLVLAGAVAAGHRRRVYDAVVLKVLGATRAVILRAFLIEYGLLGILTAALAGAIGTATAWAVMTRVMRWEFTFLPQVVVGTALLSTAITLGLGFVGTWRALGEPAAPHLRND